MLARAAKYFHTARHLRPGQITWRVWALSKRRAGLIRLPPTPADLGGGLRPAVPFRGHDPWNSRERIAAGEFRFLDHTARLGRPVEWDAQGQPLLWQFNLHYFNYLHLLSREEQAGLCADWVRANPAGETVGWHPYPTSLRIVNWCKAGLQDDALLRGLYRQAAHLYRNVETYHPGNHLLENAKALIFAGRYFEGRGESARWLERGLKIYLDETPAQVLADGGYFERSPMYHALMLEGYLDLVNILPDGPERGRLAEAAREMTDFLLSVTHPDGQIALFNDSTTEIAPPTSALVAYARDLLNHHARKKEAFPDTGFYVNETPDSYLVIDGGAVGPDHLPAHAHADIFSYELSVGGRRLVVDSGVYEYRAGEMREYVRGTRAHNTVCVDGLDQAECWGSFRVARRFPPRGVSFRRDPDGCRFEGSFDGYARLVGDAVTHRRVITCENAQRRIVVEDFVGGSGRHLVESLVHLHPEVGVELAGAGLVLRWGDGKEAARISGDLPRVEQGWYCPRFGQRLRNKVLVWGGPRRLPARTSYAVHY
ncbi:MAG: heparinase II/III family protein [Acidobacteriota bacterium]|nr:heparinase II/III family protein [Acidobacteriota bacterium]